MSAAGPVSSTEEIPQTGEVPRHVAVIMDGNGRWARRRRLPRIAGHRQGAEAVRSAVRACVERGIEYLTLFAFSSENWRRPPEEVALLMKLFRSALSSELERLHRNGVRLRIVGDTKRFGPKLERLIAEAEARTAANRRLTLTIAANYGGRWDILQAVNRVL
jgi:undecaprenyl diphosphate synthase